MKKIFLALLFSGLSLLSQAQDTSSIERKNDITIDPILLLAVPALNVSYERLLTEDYGVGINALVGLGDDSDNFTQFSPFFRMYFGKGFASGFFVEGFIPVTTSDFETTYETTYDPVTGYYNYYTDFEKKTTVGFGVGLGGKWVVKRNIVFEGSIGIARRFGGNLDYDNVTGKGMLGIGYRF